MEGTYVWTWMGHIMRKLMLPCIAEKKVSRGALYACLAESRRIAHRACWTVFERVCHPMAEPWWQCHGGTRARPATATLTVPMGDTSVAWTSSHIHVQQRLSLDGERLRRLRHMRAAGYLGSAQLAYTLSLTSSSTLHTTRGSMLQNNTQFTLIYFYLKQRPQLGPRDLSVHLQERT